MTTNQHATVTGEAEAPPTACGCRNGDPAATLAIQRQLVERAIERDPAAVGELFDRYAEDVYGYVLGWTRDAEVAEQLTERVFHDVLGWLPVMQQGDGELAAWLIAMARDAVAHGPHGHPATVEPTDPAQAISLLDDPEREVVIFRLLLGHSLLHSAHLAGYRPRVAKALQFIACTTLWRNSVDPAAASAAVAASGEQAAVPRDGATPPPYYLDPKHDRRRADEFEVRLNEPWGASAAKGDDPELDNAMTVASTLRLAAPNLVAPPDPAFMSRVREELMADVGGGQASPAVPIPPVPTRVARKVGAHTRAGGLLAMLAGTRRLQLVAVLAALVVGVTAAVVVSASLSGPRSKCGSGGCLASATTTGAAVVPGAAPTPTQAPLVASSSTSAGSAGSSTTAATAPPTTRARAAATTTVPPTTARPTTTRRATTTTAKPTTTTPPTTTEPPTTTTTAAPPLVERVLDLIGG